jgi:hypothetical protein
MDDMDISSSEEEVLSRMSRLELTEQPSTSSNTPHPLPLQPKSLKPTTTIPSNSAIQIPLTSLHKITLFPYLLSGYVNLAFSVLVAAFWLYLLRSFVAAIHSDIERKVQLFSEEVLEQIARCSRDYRENRCDPATRVPAAAAACAAWEQCMARDPYVVAAQSQLSAQTVAESLNAFFDALTWKTIACLFLLCLGLVLSYSLAGAVARDGAGRSGKPRSNSLSRRNI